MTSPGRYQPPSGPPSRSSGDAATRGAVLIVVAVAIGVALLWWGGVGGDESLRIEAGQSDETGTDTDGQTDGDDTAPDATDAIDTTGTTDTAAGDTTPDPTAASPTSTRPVGEVKVVVANGVGEAGLAGSRAGVLNTAGYVTKPFNAKCQADDCSANQIALSTVFYKEGYADDAGGVAIALGGDSNVLRPAPADVLALLSGTTTDVADFHVFVIIGADRLLG